MMSCSLFSTIAVVALCLTLGVGAVRAAEPAPPVAPAGSVACDVKEGQLRLYNDKVAIVIEQSSGKLLGIWSAGGLKLVDNTLSLGRAWMPLWSAQVLASGAAKPAPVDGAAVAPVTKIETPADGSRRVVMTWTNVPVGELKLAATLRITLAPGDALARWSMDAGVTEGSGGVWSVTYPQLAVLGSDPEANANRKIIPYRRGTEGPFARDSVRFDTQQPYPGPAAKFQFMATYGQTTGEGVYIAAHDGDAWSKVFIQRNYADKNAILLAIEHLPFDRAAAKGKWQAPYDVIAGQYRGDWYDACRIYRQWWLQQVWASKGLLQDRADLPVWVKRAVAVSRTSTTQPTRTVALNIKGYEALAQVMPQTPILGVWYGPFKNLTGGVVLESEGHGQIRGLKDGVADALTLLRSRGVHHIAYIQSLIYDPEAATPEDVSLAQKAVTRNAAGEPFLYGPPKLSMCRATPWWQQRLVDMSVQAMKDGFEGIYLDSFGKGDNECLDPTHGHPLGGGNTVITGQRQAAQRIIEAIRQINPEAVISGEAPVEAFRDLIHVNLYAKNTWDGYVPAFRAIWGDYSLGFGRTIRSSKEGPANLIPELGTLFVEGTMFGRFFTDSGTIEIAGPEFAAARNYLQLLNDYALAGIDHLRFGDMLKPLTFDVPTITFLESTENGKTTVPVIQHSVTRSHRDGSAAVVLTNIGAEPVTVNVPIDPAWRKSGGEATLWQMDRQGKLTKLAAGASTWNQPVTVAPADVVFLVLR